MSLAIDAHNLGSETKRATGIPLFMAIGQCGSVLGSHIFPSTEGPQYMYVISKDAHSILITHCSAAPFVEEALLVSVSLSS